MSDLISRADALNNLEAQLTVYKRNAKYDDRLNNHVKCIKKEIDIIKALPSAEAVTLVKPNTAYCENGEWRVKTETSYLIEVVRCKDCRHRDLFSCPLADNDFQKDEDFCSLGERREP